MTTTTRQESAILLPAAQARVLVTEDHPVNRVFAQKILDSFRIGTIEVVANGREVIERYRQAPWDIIVLDGHMPEKNGYDTALEIREIEKTTGKHVAIIGMTARAAANSREKCLRHGMDDYLTKPFNAPALRAIMNRWLHFDNLAQDAAIPSKPDEGALLDLWLVRGYSGGNKAAEKELIATLIEKSDKNLETLESPMVQTGSPLWIEAAHMFKGSAIAIGSEPLRELCDEAQYFAGNDADCAALLKEIRTAYTQIKAYLREIGLLS